jgi:cytochrome b6-f complex iron-sulfur subunit
LRRRHLLWAALVVSSGALGILSLIGDLRFLSNLKKFLLPNPTLQPSTVFSIGRLSDFTPGVHTKFIQQNRICVVRNSQRVYAIYARCTHLGCTPDWVAGADEFKCPCHGSHFCIGSVFDGNGINCAGPAPRPLDRVHIELKGDGQIVLDTNRLYRWPSDARSEFDDPGAYIPLPQA